jgi:hypothetical protein
MRSDRTVRTALARGIGNDWFRFGCRFGLWCWFGFGLRGRFRIRFWDRFRGRFRIGLLNRSGWRVDRGLVGWSLLLGLRSAVFFGWRLFLPSGILFQIVRFECFRVKYFLFSCFV